MFCTEVQCFSNCSLCQTSGMPSTAFHLLAFVLWSQFSGKKLFQSLRSCALSTFTQTLVNGLFKLVVCSLWLRWTGSMLCRCYVDSKFYSQRGQAVASTSIHPLWLSGNFTLSAPFLLGLIRCDFQCAGQVSFSGCSMSSSQSAITCTFEQWGCWQVFPNSSFIPMVSQCLESKQL